MSREIDWDRASDAIREGFGHYETDEAEKLLMRLDGSIRAALKAAEPQAFEGGEPAVVRVIDLFEEARGIDGVDLPRLGDLFWERFQVTLLVGPQVDHDEGPEAYFYVTDDPTVVSRIDFMRGFVEGALEGMGPTS